MALFSRMSNGGYVRPFVSDQSVESVIKQFFSEPDALPRSVGTYAVDVREDETHLTLEAELPGFTKDEVNITLENHKLTITAEHPTERTKTTERKTGWLLRERRFGQYQRSFMLPKNVDDQKCEASLNDGVLKITLDKREENKPRRITVS